MYSIRSLDRAVLSVAAMLLAACQADPAAENLESTEAASPANIAEAGTAAPVPIPPAAEPAERYRFTGTEPFWGGTIDGSKLLYQTPEDQAGKAITATVVKQGAASRYSGTLDGQPFVLVLTPGICSDGMSDTVYPLVAALTVHGEQRNGCANPLVGATASSQTPPATPAP